MIVDEVSLQNSVMNTPKNPINSIVIDTESYDAKKRELDQAANQVVILS